MAAPILAVLLTAVWIPVFAFRAENLRAALPFYSGSERFWSAASVAVFSLHAAVGGVLVSLTDPLSTVRTAVGVALPGLGLGLWLRARRQIMPLRVRRLPDDAPATLRRDGAFRFVRNPCYLAYLLIAAGPLIVTASAWLAGTWVAGFVALARRAAQEEQRLHAQLGAAYADYCATAKRLIPFVW